MRLIEASRLIGRKSCKTSRFVDRECCLIPPPLPFGKATRGPSHLPFADLVSPARDFLRHHAENELARDLDYARGQ
jgi:hypothetical protein